MIAAYWNLVQASIVAWAQGISRWSNRGRRSTARRLKAGLADLKDVAQARVTYTTFKANLVAANAAVLPQDRRVAGRVSACPPMTIAGLCQSPRRRRPGSAPTGTN